MLKLQNTQAAEDVAVEAVREALERQQSASTALVCNRTRVAIPAEKRAGDKARRGPPRIGGDDLDLGGSVGGSGGPHVGAQHNKSQSNQT
mgnify:FL=1